MDINVSPIFYAYINYLNLRYKFNACICLMAVITPIIVNFETKGGKSCYCPCMVASSKMKFIQRHNLQFSYTIYVVNVNDYFLYNMVC